MRDEYLQAAQLNMAAFKTQNPFDRFNKSEDEIVRIIARDFATNGVSNPRARSIINSCVVVGGKGWTSY